MAAALAALTSALSCVHPAGVRGEVEWIDVPAGGNTLRAAVARPDRKTPAPMVLVLHARTGFLQSYVSQAERFAEAGFVGVAGCWFAGRADEDPAAIPCPDAPVLSTQPNTGSLDPIRALIAAGRSLPGVRPARVGLWGQSYGAIGSLLTVSTGNEASAAVASGARAGSNLGRCCGGTSPIDVVDGLSAPVLLLNGTADDTAPVEEVREYEQAALARGKAVESHYYEGAGHNIPWVPPTSTDVFNRSALFLDQRLKAEPELSLEVPGRQRLATVASKGLKTKASCSEACKIELEMADSKRTLGDGSAELSAAGGTRVVLKPTRAGRKALGRAEELRLTVSGQATDLAGNLGRAEERVKLKR